MGDWLICPLCGRKTKIRILPETVLLHFPLYYPRCKSEVLISIVNERLSGTALEYGGGFATPVST